MKEENTIILPQPDEITRREREDAMGAYFMMFAAWGIGLPLPFLNLVAAGIYYGINRKKSKFVAFHALQSLTSQIPVTVVNAGLLFWLIRNLVTEIGFFSSFWIYLSFAVVINVAYLVTSLIALTRAYKGNFFYFPIFGRLAFDSWYGANAPEGEAGVRPNRPPDGF
ncbi:MAG: DUF4870 domain-containing protein [Spirochaetaceae bacterium]|nr:DUF4870 domain-containing protein [Spirochaetaceae bacterium]